MAVPVRGRRNGEGGLQSPLPELGPGRSVERRELRPFEGPSRHRHEDAPVGDQRVRERRRRDFESPLLAEGRGQRAPCRHAVVGSVWWATAWSRGTGACATRGAVTAVVNIRGTAARKEG